MAGASGNFEFRNGEPPNYRELYRQQGQQPAGEGASFEGIIHDTTISPTSSSALDAVPQPYTPPEGHVPDIADGVSDQIYPETDYVGIPPAVDYFETQGEKVVYDKDNNPPASDPMSPYIPSDERRQAIPKRRSLLDPDSSTKPLRLRMQEEQATLNGDTAGTAAPEAHKPSLFHRPSRQTMRAAVAAGVSLAGIGFAVTHPGDYGQRVDEKKSGYILDYVFDKAEVELNLKREFFGEKPLLSNTDTDDCLLDTPYGGTQTGETGPLDVHITGRHNPFRKHLVDKEMTVVVHALNDETKPDLVFKRTHTFPYDEYGPADAYTQQVVDEQDCQAGTDRNGN